MNCNPNQIKYGVVKAVNFIIKSRLNKNDTEMYSTYNGGESVMLKDSLKP